MAHYHPWIMAATGRAAFVYGGGGFGSRSAARAFARRDRKRRPFFVRECDDPACKLRETAETGKRRRKRKRRLRAVA